MGFKSRMRRLKQPLIISLTLITLLLLIFGTVHSPASLNHVSVSSGVQFVTQQANQLIIHACDSSTGWTNLTVTDMTFSVDAENKSEGQASLSVIVNFTLGGSVVAFYNDDEVEANLTGLDFTDFYIRANDTLGNLFFVMYDSSGYNMYWNFEPATADYDDFTFFQLDMESASFEHALFDRSEIDTTGFQTNGVGVTRIWLDAISVSNFQHIYSPSYSDSYRNVSLSSGVLGLSKDAEAYQISSSTADRISTSISSWFHGSHFRTTFHPVAQVETSLSFSVNTRARGEPSQITGVSSWSFDEDSSTLSLTCSSGASVSFFFYSLAEAQTVWIIENIPLWMGLAGFGMMIFSPAVAVALIKDKQETTGLLVLMFGLAIGASFVIGWLWG